MAYGLGSEGGSTGSRHAHARLRVAAVRSLQPAARPRGGPLGVLPARRDDARLLHLPGGEPGPGRDRFRGNRVFHEMSHGESFLAVIGRRFDSPGFYCLDEPEAALSFTSTLSLMHSLLALAADGGQVLCATHSPVLAALPGATMLEVGDWGLRETGLAGPRAGLALAALPRHPGGLPAPPHRGLIGARGHAVVLTGRGPVWNTVGPTATALRCGTPRSTTADARSWWGHGCSTTADRAPGKGHGMVPFAQARRRRARNIASVPCRCGQSWTVPCSGPGTVGDVGAQAGGRRSAGPPRRPSFTSSRLTSSDPTTSRVSASTGEQVA